MPIMTEEILSSGIPDFEIAPWIASLIPSVTSGVVDVLNVLRIPR